MRTATPPQDMEHLCRKPAGYLTNVGLLNPASEVILEALDVQTIQ